MMATTFHKVRSSHPEDDADGRVFAPGELVPDLDLDSPYNQEKIADGIFYSVDEDAEGAPPPTAGSGGPDVTSAAKRLASENNIDLSEIEGTGKDGRIIDEDVQKAIEQQAEEDADDANGGD